MLAAVRHVARSLFLTLLFHALAMISMAALLLPMMPGGGTGDDAARMSLIAARPWIWRLGWVPWHLTALSDLYLAWALFKMPRAPRGGAIVVMLLTVVAVAADQGAQAVWITRGVDLARSGDLAAYLAMERWVFPLTGMWAALLYTLAALGWTYCFVKAGAWSRALSGISLLLWPLFLLITAVPLTPIGMDPKLVAAGNAIGFLLMELWFVLVLEEVLRLERPDAAHGRYVPWRHPSRRKVWEMIGNSRAVRYVAESMPVLAFASDVTDVLYVNYLVPVGKLASLVPPRLELQVLGGKWTMFTFLTYRHGGFGPRILGPLRRMLMPQAVQSNWRIYVRDPKSKKEGIYFVTNTITTLIHSLGARVMAEGMPMHLAARGEVAREADGTMRVTIDPGQGSAPDAQIVARPSSNRVLEGPWTECFDSYEAMLAYTVPQDRAMSAQPWKGWVTCQEIDLGIPIDICEPLEAEVKSRAAEAIVGDARPLCFRVPTVRFRFDGEEHR
jgi:hypothetical protein